MTVELELEFMFVYICAIVESLALAEALKIVFRNKRLRAGTSLYNYCDDRSSSLKKKKLFVNQHGGYERLQHDSLFLLTLK